MKKTITILLINVFWIGSIFSQIKTPVGTVYYKNNNSIYTIYNNVNDTLIGQKGIEFREGKETK